MFSGLRDFKKSGRKNIIQMVLMGLDFGCKSYDHTKIYFIQNMGIGFIQEKTWSKEDLIVHSIYSFCQ